ncbi:MAG: hypothetical protein QXQ70_01275 [Candidatus Caldarchaeum sp.]
MFEGYGCKQIVQSLSPCEPEYLLMRPPVSFGEEKIFISVV